MALATGGAGEHRGATKLGLPRVKIAGQPVWRLVAGGDPVRSFSHSSQELSRLMLRYFTPERIDSFRLRCETTGIHTFQSSYSKTVGDGILGAREPGSKIQPICLDPAGRTPWKEVLRLQRMAIRHHGIDTDLLFREGRQERIHGSVKRVHDAGPTARRVPNVARQRRR